MSHACHDHGHGHDHVDASSHGYRAILWIALALNGAMFVIELAAGLDEGSVALQADAIDFLADSMTFALTLFVLGRALAWRASAGIAKAAMMSAFGLWVIATAVRQAMSGGIPTPEVMGVVGFMALGVNLACAALFFRHRKGDSNRRSVWLCSRNDAIGNVLVILAGAGVFATDTAWPDIGVGLVMALLELSSAYLIFRQAFGEMRLARAA
jgi:Co/Zn/Cd efflux system component